MEHFIGNDGKTPSAEVRSTGSSLVFWEMRKFRALILDVEPHLNPLNILKYISQKINRITLILNSAISNNSFPSSKIEVYH